MGHICGFYFYLQVVQVILFFWFIFRESTIRTWYSKEDYAIYCTLVIVLEMWTRLVTWEDGSTQNRRPLRWEPEHDASEHQSNLCYVVSISHPFRLEIHRKYGTLYLSLPAFPFPSNKNACTRVPLTRLA